MKFLLVEDEQLLAESIAGFLQNEGHLCSVAHSFRAAVDKLDSFEYDLVILDITLPDGSGMGLIPLIKENHPGIGTLILSAKNSLDDKIEGLDLGADDYLTKPFHLAELNSRINAILRRRQFEGKHVIQNGDIEVDPAKREAKVSGSIVDLTKKEFDLLLYFLINKNRVLTKEAITTHLWDDQVDAMDKFDFIYTHVKNLRKKIRSVDGTDLIETVYGVGYKMVHR